MKRKAVRRTRHTATKRQGSAFDYLVVVRSWMLVVVFALMLGLGAIMGHFLNLYLEGATSSVAGIQTQR